MCKAGGLRDLLFRKCRRGKNAGARSNDKAGPAQAQGGNVDLEPARLGHKSAIGPRQRIRTVLGEVGL
eukprot:1988836-Pyramimonas_sp.AAC.1